MDKSFFKELVSFRGGIGGIERILIYKKLLYFETKKNEIRIL